MPKHRVLLVFHNKGEKKRRYRLKNTGANNMDLAEVTPYGN
jgi:hypothetical protein